VVNISSVFPARCKHIHAQSLTGHLLSRRQQKLECLGVGPSLADTTCCFIHNLGASPTTGSTNHKITLFDDGGNSYQALQSPFDVPLPTFASLHNIETVGHNACTGVCVCVCVCVCVVCISATIETISAKKAETIEIPFGGRTRDYGLKEPRIIWECTFAPPGEYDGSINVAAAMRPNVPIL